MGTYLFERVTSDGTGPDAGASLREDVAKALDEIDWVDTFSIHTDDGDGSVVTADVIFDEQWPDVRTSNPDQVSEVFHRLGLRTLANPTLSAGKVSTDDPLRAEPVTDDAASLDLFVFDEE